MNKPSKSSTSCAYLQDVASYNISLASSGHLPSLTLDGSYGLSEQTYSSNSQNDYDADNLNIGLNLVVPLYTGGNTTSLTKQAEYNYVAASEDLEATYRKRCKDVRAFNNNISASIGALRAYEQLLFLLNLL